METPGRYLNLSDFKNNSNQTFIIDILFKSKLIYGIC